MKKRAATNWVIGRLLNMVLLVILLVLIIYGVSTKGLNPLIDQIGSKADEVLILLNIKDDISSKNCLSEKVSVIGGGEKLLKKLEIGGDAVLNVCRNAICSISNAGLDMYRRNNGNFERLVGDKWERTNKVLITDNSELEFIDVETEEVDSNFLFSGNTDSIKLNWEVYNKGVDILEEDSVKSFYDDRFTKQFILYGDGAVWPDKPTKAIWQNDYWKVSIDGGKFETIKDNDKAIKAFIAAADDYWPDKVYWKEEISLALDGDFTIDAISFGKLNNKESIERLKTLFIKKKNEFLEKAKPSEEDIEKLKDAVSGKSFLIGDKTFVVSVEEGEKYPIIILISNGDKFGLKYNANVKKNNKNGVPLRYYPVSLVVWKDSSWKDIGNENYYRLPEKYFKEAYRGTLLASFLESKCR